MTMVPYGPLWCWGVQGEDVVFFSQRTHVYSGGYVPLADDRCIARCQFQSWMEEPDGSYRTPLIQCGHVAQIAEDGTALCRYHGGHVGACAWCEELAAMGSTKACPGCHAIWREQDFPDWCCPADTRDKE